MVNGSDVVRALEKAGFLIRRRRGSHVIMGCSRRRVTVSVPVHAGRKTPTGTLRGILRRAGVSVDEFVDLLD